MLQRSLIFIIVSFLLSSGCIAPIEPLAEHPQISVSETPYLISRADCEDRFIAHELDHMTTTEDGVVRMFEANGSGLAVADLNNDGWLDLVLGNHAGPNTILWNGGSGELDFRTTRFGTGGTRAVTAVDIDNDGWRDLVLTLNTGALNYWHNEQNDTFERQVLPGVAHPAYVLGWADLDVDGDLDLVTASYDAGFLTDLGNNYLLEDGGGVFVYTNEMGKFMPTKLANEAQALTLALFDLNLDGRNDILIGNDFDIPDFAFMQSDQGWVKSMPFEQTTHSTMSFDVGDVNNDRNVDLFASDMKPFELTAETEAAWAPLMAAMSGDDIESGSKQGETQLDDTQVMENVLQLGNASGQFQDVASAMDIDATGWSWSGVFGDLDNDGYQDLYVVNGMIEETIFSHLPDHELVEANLVFRNSGGVGFTHMRDWGLSSRASGRSMAMADLDRDGDLDIVINNLRSPAQLFENRLCGGRSLQVRLIQSFQQNTDAIGARITLETSIGPLTRIIQPHRGYLSFAATTVHFGFPANAEITELTVTWPDGQTSQIQQPRPGYFHVIERAK